MKALTRFQANVLRDVEAHEPAATVMIATRLEQRNVGQTRVALKTLERLGLIEEHDTGWWRLTPKGAGWVQPRHTSRDSWLEEGIAAGWITNVEAAELAP